jgi:DNA-binding MarR family transcriptional regulator
MTVMANQSKYSATYLRFLNLVQAIREIPTFPVMDPVEERLLTMLAAVWHREKKITVLEAMSLTHEISATTAHRRLKTLRKKGMIDLDVDQSDSRVKYVVPTTLAKQYFTALGQALDKAQHGV